MSTKTQNYNQQAMINHLPWHLLDDDILEEVDERSVREVMMSFVACGKKDEEDGSGITMPGWGTRRPRTIIRRRNSNSEVSLEVEEEVEVENGVVKVRAGMSKLLIAAAFTAILTATSPPPPPVVWDKYDHSKKKEKQAEQHHPYFSGGCAMEDVEVMLVLTQWVAILLMMIGIYLRLKYSTVSKLLEIVGQLTCVLGLMLMQSPFNRLSCNLLWVTSLLIGAVLGAAMVVAG